MEQNKILTCCRCSRQLVLAKADFTYMERTFHTDVYRCPVCGKVCILPGLAEGKMAEVELMLEDK